VVFWFVFFLAKFWDTEWRWCFIYPKSYTDSYRCTGGISSAGGIKQSNVDFVLVFVQHICRFQGLCIFITADSLIKQNCCGDCIGSFVH